MAKSRLELIIDATDNASSVFGKVGQTMKVGLMVGAAAAGAGIAALTKVLGDCVSEAMAAEQAQAQLNAVLASTKGVSGMTAESINEIATSLSQVTRFEDDAIVSAQSLLLTFTKVGSDVFPQATETILNMSTALGQDLKTSAVQVGKALNDPIAGVTALRRVGVQLTEQQEEQIKSFMAVGDIASAQKVILGELETQFGGVARAAGETLAGKLDILKNQFGNIKEEVGNALIPVLSNLISQYGPQLVAFIQRAAEWMTNQLIPAIQSVASWIGDNLVPAISTLVGWIGDQLGPVIQAWQANSETLIPVLEAIGIALGAFTIITTVVGWIGSLAGAISTAAAAFATASASGGPIAALVAMLGGPVTLAIAAISAAIGVFYLAWKNNWFGIRDTLTNIWEGKLKPAFESLKAWLAATLTAAIKTLTDFWNNTLLPALRAIWAFIQNYLIPLFQALANLLTAVVGVAVTALQGLWQNVLLPALQEIWRYIQNNLMPIFQSLAERLQGPLTAAVNVAKAVFDGLKGAFDGIGNAISSVIGWIDRVATKLLSIKLPAWLTPGSPTPFEYGLRGIASAMADLSRYELPRFQAQLAMTGAQAGVSNVNTYNVTVNTQATSGTYLADVMMARALVGA